MVSDADEERFYCFDLLSLSPFLSDPVESPTRDANTSTESCLLTSSMFGQGKASKLSSFKGKTICLSMPDEFTLATILSKTLGGRYIPAVPVSIRYLWVALSARFSSTGMIKESLHRASGKSFVAVPKVWGSVTLVVVLTIL